jgi:hypothetical protein
MNLSRVKIAAALLIIFSAGAGVFAYLKYRDLSESLINRLDAQAGKRLGRQVKFKKAVFSPLEGVVIEEPCVSRAPDFSKGTFFCAKRAVIRPDLARLMKNRLYFSNVEFENPVIKVREAGGKWDFEDLLALLPKTSKGLHITWNAGKLALKNARVEIDLASSGRSFSLENSDIKLLHHYASAGNFEFSLNGDIKTVMNGQLLTAKTYFNTDLNFEYAGLTSAFGAVEFSDAALGASTLKKAEANWKLFNINKSATENNYTLGLKAEGLFVPAQSGGVKRTINNAMNLLSSILGRETPRVEDLEMDSLALDLTLNDGILRLKRLALAANFLDLLAEYE